MSCKVVIVQDHEGRRLDRTIRSIWPALPLSAVMRGLRRGDVRLDAVRAREGKIRVHAGQELFVPWEDPLKDRLQPRVRDWGTVPVIWRGENALVIDKPANLLVQPDEKGGDSVISRVWTMFGSGGSGFSPAAVHRLDRNTTGVLIVALSGEGLRALELLFRERRVDKRYLAVVTGEIPARGIIDAPLVKDETENVVCVRGDGKTARTRYRRLDAGGGLSLASIELLTGRTHQARVHMAHIGHAILGDRKYGNIGTNRLWQATVRRPLLHARELIFPKDLPGPLTGLAGKTFRADLPGDMRAIIEKQGWTTEVE
jgi:RluA family pseudouridine synthase